MKLFNITYSKRLVSQNYSSFTYNNLPEPKDKDISRRQICQNKCTGHFVASTYMAKRSLFVNVMFELHFFYRTGRETAIAHGHLRFAGFGGIAL